MRETTISLSELDLIAATRAATGFGLGLLLAGYFSAGQRRAIGWALVAVGAASTVPLLRDVLKHARTAT